MTGQDDYYLQTLESVVQFVENLSETYQTDLKLEEGEDLPNEMEEWGWSSDQSGSPEKEAPLVSLQP